MTYIPVDRILVHIPNKFEAIKVAALECRRLNEKLQAMEDVDDHEEKITTLAVQRLMDGEVHYHDARERREQERSEAMLAAAEEMLDMTAPSADALAELGALPEEEAGEAPAEASVAPAAPASATVDSAAEDIATEDIATEDIATEASAAAGEAPEALEDSAEEAEVEEEAEPKD